MLNFHINLQTLTLFIQVLISFVGGRGRAKPKFSIHSSYTHMGGMPSSHGLKVENEKLPPEGIKNYADFINLHETNENSMSELLGDLQEKKTQLLDKFVSHKPIAAPSMAELLEGLQENNNHFLGASNLVCFLFPLSLTKICK